MNVLPCAVAQAGQFAEGAGADAVDVGDFTVQLLYSFFLPFTSIQKKNDSLLKSAPLSFESEFLQDANEIILFGDNRYRTT